ncbi:MAG: hypothetical protein U9N52_13105 [Campylobacterota bacterium]|nr:hypothetical protein [Campylobacterota bacterium]
MVDIGSSLASYNTFSQQMGSLVRVQVNDESIAPNASSQNRSIANFIRINPAETMRPNQNYTKVETPTPSTDLSSSSPNSTPLSPPQLVSPSLMRLSTENIFEIQNMANEVKNGSLRQNSQSEKSTTQAQSQTPLTASSSEVTAVETEEKVEIPHENTAKAESSCPSCGAQIETFCAACMEVHK